MKIVYCIPGLYKPGGMERVLTIKANYLASHGYEVIIVTTEGGEKPFFELNSKVKLVNFSLHFDNHFDSSILKKYFLHKKLIKRYIKLLDEFLQQNNVDICVSMCGKEIEFLSKLKCNCAKIAEFHSMQNYRAQILLSQHSGFIWRIIGNYLTCDFVRSTRKVEKFVVLTKEDAMQWRKTNNNIEQIYNPSPISPKGIPALKEKRFIAVGRLDAGKGYDYLIEAWSLVAKQHPDWRLDIFGQGDSYDKILKDIQQRNLSSTVKLCGTTKNITDEYYNSSGFVMTSRYEGFPMALIEAATCGLPLVAFDCKTGPKEIIYEGVNGFLIPMGDVKVLAEKICLLIDSQNKRIYMGRNAMELAKEYSIDNIMAHWIQLFEHLSH